jgi:outer membrane protein
LLGLLLLGVRSGVAQNPATALTLEDCVHLAQSAPSSVTRARQQIQIAKYEITRARANFLPQFSVANTFTYNSPLLFDHNAFSFIALNGIREYSSLATSTLEVDSSGRLRAILARAQADRDAANANLILSVRDLKRVVAAGYYHVLLARKLATSAQANLKEAKAFEDRVRLLVNAGEASQADLTKASLETAVFEQTLAESNLEMELANHELASFWTTDVDAPLELKDVLDDTPSPPGPGQPDAPYLLRPEFKFFDAQGAGYLASAHQARAQLLPQLNLSFQYGVDALQATSRDRGYAGFVHLEIPVFDWLRASSESHQFRLQAQQVETDRNVAKRLFSKEYQDALAEVNVLYGQIPLAAAQVKLALENLRLSRLRYEGGEGSALEVVTAQTGVAQAQITYYTSRANYLNAQVGLQVASGR